MIQEAFGARVKELRNNLLISQAELSKKTGIERAQISKIEQGKINVTLETIDRLSKALNVPMKELLDIKEVSILRPFVKWAGGKTQILNKLKEYLPSSFNTYFEPFVGGGALFFALTPKKAIINDNNPELICAYKCLQDDLLYEKLIYELEFYEGKHSEEFYYEIREMDRDPNFLSLPIYVRAARMIYLNKACFNGLYRVNSKGYFNVPSGRKERVNTFDRDNMSALKQYFKNNEITVLNEDFSVAVGKAKEGDFVYFDPPYDTYEDKNSFTSYSKDSFGKKSQKILCDVYKELDKRGVKVMLSNHNTKFINELYSGYNIHIIEAKRMINSDAKGRGNVEEVIITNY